MIIPRVGDNSEIKILEIIHQMSDYQKKSLKEFYEWNKSGLCDHGTRAAKPMERLGVIEYSGSLTNWQMYRITELGKRVAEILLLDELRQKEEDLKRRIASNGDPIQIHQKHLDEFREKLKNYGVLK